MSLVLSGLRLNILETEKMLQFWGKILSARRSSAKVWVSFVFVPFSIIYFSRFLDFESRGFGFGFYVGRFVLYRGIFLFHFPFVRLFTGALIVILDYESFTRGENYWSGFCLCFFFFFFFLYSSNIDLFNDGDVKVYIYIYLYISHYVWTQLASKL